MNQSQYQDLNAKLEVLTATLETRFEKIDERFEKIDERFVQFDDRLNAIESRMITKADVFQAVLTVQGFTAACIVGTVVVLNAIGVFGA